MLELRGRKHTSLEEALLLKLYISTRIDEFALLGWTEDHLILFLRSQYGMQKHTYSKQYPHAHYNLIYEAGVCIGRLITNQQKDHIHIVDISLFPNFRGKGHGTELLKALQMDAKEKQVPITLNVIIGNPAIHLYKRLGFVDTTEAPPYLSMRYESF